MGEGSGENEEKMALGEWIGGNRRGILRAIRFHNGEANTSEIRDDTGMSRGTFRHHIEKLLDPPENLLVDGEPLEGRSFVEVVSVEDVGSGIPARRFVLTEVGKYVFKETVNDVSIRVDDVHDLQQQVEELELELGEAQEKIESLVEENERLSELHDELAEGMEEIIKQNDLTYNIDEAGG